MRHFVAILLVGLAMGVATAAWAAEADNPVYQQWAKFKVGTSAQMRQTMAIAGTRSESEVTHTLVELTADKAVVETGTIMVIAGKKIESPKVKVEHRAKLDATVPGANEAAPVPAATRDVAKPVREELTIDGQKFTCDKYESTVDQGGTKVHATLWNCGDVPGGLVKSVTVMECAAAGETVLELISIHLVK